MTAKLAALLERAQETGSCGIFLPAGAGDVFAVVPARIRKYADALDPTLFVTWAEALKAEWPQLWQTDREAFFFLVCELYLSGAEEFGFIVVPEKIGLGDEVTNGDTNRVYGDARGDDGKAVGGST